LVTFLAMVCLQAAAAGEQGNTDKAEADSQKPVAEQQHLLMDPTLQANIPLKVYHGGHMPYLHQQSRLALFEDAQDFYRSTP
jgi:hypothetical protein